MAVNQDGSDFVAQLNKETSMQKSQQYTLCKSWTAFDEVF
jgi:hypothetical protein